MGGRAGEDDGVVKLLGAGVYLVAGTILATQVLVSWATADPQPIVSALLVVVGSALCLRYAWGGVVVVVLGLLLDVLITRPPHSAFELFAPLVAVFVLSVRRVPWHAITLSTVSVGVDLWMSRRAVTVTDWAMAVVLWVSLHALAWFVGLAVVRVRERGEAEARARQLARQREIAVELHDYVAHDLALIAMRAEAARLKSIPTDDVFGSIAETARRADFHLRSLVTMLGVESAPPLRSLADSLDDGQRALNEAGFDPRLSVHGAIDQLAVPQSDALARVTREAVNNIVRHGTPDWPVNLVVTVGPDVTELEFTNAMRAPVGREPVGHRLGLDGMERRMEAMGGTCSFGAHEGVWTLRVVLPTARRPAA